MKCLIFNIFIIAIWSQFFCKKQFIESAKTSNLECMFLGYPELEYDGFDRTEV